MNTRLLRYTLGTCLPVLSAMMIMSPSVQGQARSRTEEINQQRRIKLARLWPEKESGIVTRLNKMVERGLLEGFESKKGTNGWQLVLGGMRSGHGFTLGAGYRRSDLWNERLGVRVTARGTRFKAYMFDFEGGFQSLRSERAFLWFYTKYEDSPQMDYYGPGPYSRKESKTSYRLEDTSMDVEGA